MGISDTLEKLAEKRILNGDLDGAYALISTAEKMQKKCKYCPAETDKKMCSKCAKMTKCALKGCDAKMHWGEMVKKGGKAYCCKDCAKADQKTERTALDELVAKYAGKKDEQEYANIQEEEANKKWDEFKAKGKKKPEDIKPSKKKSALDLMLAKYARDYWEPTSEEVYEKEMPLDGDGVVQETDFQLNFDKDPQGSLIESLQALADQAHETYMESRSDYHSGLADGIEKSIEYIKNHLT